MLRQFLLGGDEERGREREAASPGSASSLSSSASSNDSYLAEDVYTPRQYQSPAYLPPSLLVPPAAQPYGSSSSSSSSPTLLRLSRSTSAPFSPSLSAHAESPMPPPSRRLGVEASPFPSSSSSSSSSLPPPQLPHQQRHAHHRPRLSLHVEVPVPAPSALSASPSALPAADELSSHQVELSPMHRRVVKARAMSAGSPIHYRPYSPHQLEEQKAERSGLVRELSAPTAAADGVSYFPRAYSDGEVRMQQEPGSASEAASPMPLLQSVSRQPSFSMAAAFRSMSAASSARRPRKRSRSCRERAKLLSGACLRRVFLSLMFTALFILAFLILVEFRTVTLYNNVVCRPSTSIPIDEYAPAVAAAAASVSASSLLSSSSLPAPNSSSPSSSNSSSPSKVSRTQTTIWHGKAYAVLWNVFASFWGVVSFVRYSSSALLSTLSPRIRVPAAFSSAAPAFQPNYSLSPRLLSLPINHFRYAGSHNSYHMQSSYPIPAFAYSHASIPAQLGDYTDGVRQIELDLHFLPGSGGTVVYHVQLVDDHINCYCLEECLLLVRDWSAAHPLHFPIMLMLEVKRQAYEDVSLGLTGITCNDLYNMHIALEAVFPPGTFLLPRDVRGDFPSVFAALSYQAYIERKTNRWNTSDLSRVPTAEEEERMRPLHKYATANSSSYGWPPLGSMLGRLLLVWLDDVYNYADRLPCVRDDPSSQHALMFIAQAQWNKTYSAIQISRDPVLDEQIIGEALQHGLILRALTTTASFRRRDSTRYEKALQLGVHCLASDFEQPCAGNVRTRNSSLIANSSVVVWHDVSKYGTWCERTVTGWPFECHPSISPAWCVDELNKVRMEGLRRADNGSSGSSGSRTGD